MTTTDDAVLARVFRRILTDEPGGMYVSLSADGYLTLDGSTDRLADNEAAVIRRVIDGR